MITEYIVKAFEIFTVGYGSVWFSKYLDRKKEKQESNMDKEYLRKRTVMPILDDVRYQLESVRVFESVFTNGDTTFTGHHMKKLSIISESNEEGLPDIGHHFQFIPTKKFDRVLDALYESPDDYVIFDENEWKDELASLKKMFGLNYTLVVKIRDQFNRWVGTITVVFERKTELTDSDISYVKTQAARIGGIK